jgi:thiol-disulfide isomerase/thioredoxin
MSAQWAVIVILSVLVAVDSVVIIALSRQIGILHLRTKQAPALRGPRVGSQLRLSLPPEIGQNGHRPNLLLVGFISPDCGGCAAMLPAFSDVAARLAADEQVVLASAADERRTLAYLAAHGVRLPLITGPHLMMANEIPSTPFVVAADSAGTVLASGPLVTAGQFDVLLDQARRLAGKEE